MNGYNRYYVGDCRTVLKEKFEEESVDLAIFSPPYDNIREYGRDYHFDYHGVGKQLFRVVKYGGVCCVVIGDGTKNFAKSLTTIKLAYDWCCLGMRELGDYKQPDRWQLFEDVIYRRHGRPGNWWTERFRVDHEHILMFFKGNRPKYFNKEHMMVPCKYAGHTWKGTIRHSDGSLQEATATVKSTKCRGTIWEYGPSNTEGCALKLKHHSTFPQALVRDLILCFSQPGDVVLDPMVGSGSTCVEAAKLGRKWVGIDLSREYLHIAEERMNVEVQQVSGV